MFCDCSSADLVVCLRQFTKGKKRLMGGKEQPHSALISRKVWGRVLEGGEGEVNEEAWEKEGGTDGGNPVILPRHGGPLFHDKGDSSESGVFFLQGEGTRLVIYFSPKHTFIFLELWPFFIYSLLTYTSSDLFYKSHL